MESFAIAIAVIAVMGLLLNTWAYYYQMRQMENDLQDVREQVSSLTDSMIEMHKQFSTLVDKIVKNSSLD